MKRMFLSVLLLAMFLPVLKADPVDAATARHVAERFMKNQGWQGRELADISSQMPFSKVYTFVAPQGDGFVIVSADDRALPILGFSTERTINPQDLPVNFKEWILGYEAEINYLVDNDIKPTSAVESQWRELGEGRQGEPLYAHVNALLATTWNQKPYYNDMCPYDAGAGVHTVTGCTATATAQIMKYWNHPVTGRNSNSYSSYNYGLLSADFEHTSYQWNDMPAYLDSTSTAAEVSAVATLMYHVGVAVEMDYGPSGSGAATNNYGMCTYPSAETALVTNFRYSSDLHGIYKDNYSDSQWIAMLKSELDSLRPVLYTGYDLSAGHAFVCDGYNDSNQFHFNWGWGGYCDGFYALGALNPAPGGTGGNATYTFNLDNSAIIGIKPLSGTVPGMCSITTSSTAHGSVAGGGVYNAYDYVSITATADSGYRFSGWSDNSLFTPYEFYATGNRSLTGGFEPVGGDTLYYTQNFLYSAWDVRYFGVRFPANTLSSGKVLSAVQFLPYTISGNYELRIYQGGYTAPGRLVYSDNVSLLDEGSWQTIPLNAPLRIDATQPLWVTFYCDYDPYEPYCATLSFSVGNPDESWASADGVDWEGVQGYSMMIKAITISDSNIVSIVANSNDDAMGYVTGSGYYNVGDNATLTAVPFQGYEFVSWQDGNTDNPRAVTVSGNATYTATFRMASQNIASVEESGCTIAIVNGTIKVSDIGNRTVRLFDNLGRIMETKSDQGTACTFDVPVSGTYLVQVGEHPARKVVVTK